MANTLLNTVEIEPKTAAKASIIWMHGLGANAHDFEPIVPYLNIPPEMGLRFVFPNAPQKPVTVNGGYVMPAWYDLRSMQIDQSEDTAGIRESANAISALIEREQERGIASECILLAGFSQGGAIALHTGLRYEQKLGGILALSCYLPLLDTLATERSEMNQDIPIFMAHGQMDEIIPLILAKASADHLRQLDYAVEWHEYAMRHEVNIDEIQHIGAWLRRILAEKEGTQ